MSQFSQEYLSALVIVVISLASVFGLILGSEQVSAFIVVLAGILVAIRRFKKGDIRVTGLRKV